MKIHEKRNEWLLNNSSKIKKNRAKTVKDRNTSITGQVHTTVFEQPYFNIRYKIVLWKLYGIDYRGCNKRNHCGQKR